MTKYEKLSTVIGLRGLVKTSIEVLLTSTEVRTGSSSYSRGWANKSVYTNEVSAVLTSLGIKHECLNDAPRGGANGEFVRITSPAVVKAINSVQKRISFANFLINSEINRAEKAKKAVYQAEYLELKNYLKSRIIEVSEKLNTLLLFDSAYSRLEGDLTHNEACNRAVGIVGYRYAKFLGWKNVLREISKILR